MATQSMRMGNDAAKCLWDRLYLAHGEILLEDAIAPAHCNRLSTPEKAGEDLPGEESMVEIERDRKDDRSDNHRHLHVGPILVTIRPELIT